MNLFYLFYNFIKVLPNFQTFHHMRESIAVRAHPEIIPSAPFVTVDASVYVEYTPVLVVPFHKVTVVLNVESYRASLAVT